MENLQAKLRTYLEDGENLLWVGEPKKGILFRTSDVFTIPFSLVWLGGAIFWTIGASKGSGLFGLFGVPFIIIGLMFAFGRFLLDARQRRNTVYGLTQNRVLILSGIFSRTVKSLPLRLQGVIILNEKKDGYGTISFSGDEVAESVNASLGWMSGENTNTLIESIKDAKQVYGLIVRVQREGMG